MNLFAFCLRRATCLAAVLLTAAPVCTAQPLPARNLLVETRVVDDSAATAAGTARIGSRGQGHDAAGTTLLGSSSRQGSESVQRLLVLNGARGTLRLAQGVPMNDVEVVWTPWGAGAAVRSQWVEVVNGMDVWPRWPGGDAPVLLDIGAQRASALRQGAAAQGTPPQMTLFTTVQAPPGAWVEVAQLQRRQAAVSTGGFNAATSSRQRSLQVRVSLP